MLHKKHIKIISLDTKKRQKTKNWERKHIQNIKKIMKKSFTLNSNKIKVCEIRPYFTIFNFI